VQRNAFQTRPPLALPVRGAWIVPVPKNADGSGSYGLPRLAHRREIVGVFAPVQVVGQQQKLTRACACEGFLEFLDPHARANQGDKANQAKRTKRTKRTKSHQAHQVAPSRTKSHQVESVGPVGQLGQQAKSNRAKSNRASAGQTRALR